MSVGCFPLGQFHMRLSSESNEEFFQNTQNFEKFSFTLIKHHVSKCDTLVSRIICLKRLSALRLTILVLRAVLGSDSALEGSYRQEDRSPSRRLRIHKTAATPPGGMGKTNP